MFDIDEIRQLSLDYLPTDLEICRNRTESIYSGVTQQIFAITSNGERVTLTLEKMRSHW